MVRIRLRRVGAKKQPSYRVVVTDQRSPRDGRFIENVGHYNPRTDPATVVINEARVAYWLSKGAQPSEAVARMLKKLESAKATGETETAVEVDAETAAEAKAETEPEVEAEANESEADMESEPVVETEADSETESA